MQVPSTCAARAILLDGRLQVNLQTPALRSLCVHISKLQNKRTEQVEDVVSVGDTVKVKYLGKDEKGRENLTMRDVEQN